MSKKPIILLAAGGTGGHVFPALALATELQRLDYDVRLVTDNRGMKFQSEFGDLQVHVMSAATIYGKGFLKIPFGIIRVFFSLLSALVLMVRLRPKLVIGFGGYPSFAPGVSACLLRIPVLVHEQNAVFGRANRMLAKLGAYVATSFSDTIGLSERTRRRTRRTGNPLRPKVLAETQSGYRFLSQTRAFDLLVFGGSQGARVLNQVVPDAISRLSDSHKRRLRIVHQARVDDMTDLLARYHDAGVYAEIRDFFDDMPRRIRRAHLVISRAGASTVSELAAIGAPSILVPLPGSLDADQLNNTRDLVSKGGAWVMPQATFVAGRLAARLDDLMNDRNKLSKVAQAAKSVGVLDATIKLGRYADCLATGRPVQIESFYQNQEDDK